MTHHRRFPIATLILLSLLPRTPAAESQAVLLRGAVVHTVSGEALNPGQVLIKNGRIEAVGKEVAAEGAKEVDLTGRHLYPGLIAATTLLGLTEIDAVRATRDSAEVGGYTPDVTSWIAVNPDSELIPTARANGIAYAVPTPRGGAVPGHSGMISLNGWTSEDLVFRKPLALHANWPSMALNITPKEQAQDRSKWKSPEDQAKQRRKSLSELESFFQEAMAYARAREARPSTPVNPPWESMRPALSGQIPVVVHANDFRQIRAAVEWARTNRLRLVIAGGRDAAREVSLLASNKVGVIFEHVFNRALRDTEPYDALFSTPASLAKAGVTCAISAGVDDMAETEIRNLAYHAAQAVAFGLPADQALKAITLHPAQLLGVAQELGSIDVGKQASLIALDGDILDIRSNVRSMWIAGQPVDLATRHTRLYDRYRQRPKANE